MSPRKETGKNLLVTDGMKWNWGRVAVKRPLDTRIGKTDFSWQQWEEEGRFQLTAVRRGKRKTRMVETELTVKVARLSSNSTSASHKPCDLSHLNLWSSLLNRNMVKVRMVKVRTTTSSREPRSRWVVNVECYYQDTTKEWLIRPSHYLAIGEKKKSKMFQRIKRG